MSPGNHPRPSKTQGGSGTPVVSQEDVTEEAPPGADTALKASSGTPGRMENDEGVGQYQHGHWDIAQVHFRKSLAGDPGLAEAHFIWRGSFSGQAWEPQGGHGFLQKGTGIGPARRANSPIPDPQGPSGDIGRTIVRREGKGGGKTGKLYLEQETYEGESRTVTSFIDLTVRPNGMPVSDQSRPFQQPPSTVLRE